MTKVKSNINFAADNILAISINLANLASNSLSKHEQRQLIFVINQLFLDLKNGHSCSLLNELASYVNLTQDTVINLLTQSKLASVSTQMPTTLANKPISIVKIYPQPLVYISKYLQYELDIRRDITLLAQRVVQIDQDKLQPLIRQLTALQQEHDLPNREQLQAILACMQHKLSFITGGPGTGKTTTITLLLWLLYAYYGSNIKIQICAPTGKAAMRVKEAISHNIAHLGTLIDCHLLNELISTDNYEQFGTIHKLLAYIPQSIHFKHGINNKLKLDILIVDESSMIGLALYSKLLAAINAQQIKHVIFLGDQHQLSSVEEGYVFHSLVSKINISTIELPQQQVSYSVSNLLTSKRSGQDIANLAAAVLQQDFEQLQKIIQTSAMIQLNSPRLNLVQQIAVQMSQYIELVHQLLPQLYEDFANTYFHLFTAFSRQATLSLTNVGIWGSNNLNQQIEKYLKLHFAIADIWYTGRPIIILENDYALNLYNGDIGICVSNDEQVRIVFANGVMLIPEVLPHYQLAYVISIHKAQGSEYQQINLVIPPLTNTELHNSSSAALYHRPLLYTAITRARHAVNLFTDYHTLKYMLNNIPQRNTGF